MKRIINIFPILLNLILLILIPSVHAQTFEEHTLKFPMMHEYDGAYQISQMGDKGLLVLRNRYAGEKSNVISEIQMTYVKSSFQKKWTKDISLNHYGDFKLNTYDDEFAYFLMQANKNNYQVLRIRLEDGAHKVFYYKNVEKMTVDYFEAHNNVCFFGGHAENRPIVTRWDLDSDKRNILPSVHQIKGGLYCMEFDPKSDMLTVVVKAQMTSIHRGLYILDYSMDGLIDKQYFEELQRDYNYQTFRPYHNSNGQLVMLGTYGLGNLSDETQGIYSMIISKNGYRMHPKFYDFSFFKNFYSHLDEKQKEKSEAKFHKRREKDKITPLRLEIMPNRLQFMNNQVVFVVNDVTFIYPFNDQAKYLSDGFYSKAEVPTYTSFVQNYENMIRRKGEFIPMNLLDEKMKDHLPFPIECNFNRSFACGFDYETGELKWDNTYVTRNLKTEMPIESVTAYADNRKVAFLHVNRDNFFYKISDRLKYTNNLKVVSLQDYSPGKEVKKFTSGGVQHWYSNHFIFTGTKTVKTLYNQKEKENYFFLTCLSYSNRVLSE
ncbi:hypothetical protein KMW28_04105 [Flammeovirga yaeyamensis]|uniref:Uncharacterized protein n=1 Tax=Flammeovirga yaeyamensis TaxID=367791 RepID=A0AAX1N9P8_9BACT|nr:hypothetical protein [Flammeovirga yaeyamensis]MBB3697338.1 hypothetical protein [Flammeovirga yaeyamensis]NMF36032.1 hypothetical protein [Flammeovirga yaeyamensis]QWG02767.1 hypothetical protein KMW28_04105 [Flammeovirga yaeyamensis]